MPEHRHDELTKDQITHRLTRALERYTLAMREHAEEEMGRQLPAEAVVIVPPVHFAAWIRDVVCHECLVHACKVFDVRCRDHAETDACPSQLLGLIAAAMPGVWRELDEVLAEVAAEEEAKKPKRPSARVKPTKSALH